MNGKSVLRRNIYTAIGILVVLALILWVTAYVKRQQLLSETRRASADTLVVYAANLEAEIEKFLDIPKVFASFPVFTTGLENQSDESSIESMNRKLEMLNSTVKALNTFVINASGITVASSNWNTEASFVGEDLNFRPYFKDAMRYGSDSYFAHGTTSNKRGHYYSATINAENGEALGVLVVKVEMDHLEAAWGKSSEHVAVSDGDGVVFISTRPEWIYRPIEPLDSARADSIRQSQKYGIISLDPLVEDTVNYLDADSRLIAVKSVNDTVPNYLLETSTPINNEDWRIHIYSNIELLDQNVQEHIKFIGAISLLPLILLAALINHQQSKKQRDRIKIEMNERLKKSHDQLEIQVTARTNELSEANSKLTEEISERKQTEHELRETQDQLVQAAKMAALGQMATSITHELNQPLGAIRTFTDTAQTYLSMDDKSMVKTNLGMIGNMAQRMGDIMQHLKAFARKTPPDLVPVSVDHAIAETLILTSPSIEKYKVKVNYNNSDSGSLVNAEPIRLQQILTNLIQNAIDSMRSSAKPQIDINVTAQSETVEISVRDYGTGINQETMNRLFEPFHTTKAQGDGLGLGLAITYGLVKSFDGSIDAENATDGGALFTIRLKAAMVQEPAPA